MKKNQAPSAELRHRKVANPIDPANKVSSKRKKEQSKTYKDFVSCDRDNNTARKQGQHGNSSRYSCKAASPERLSHQLQHCRGQLHPGSESTCSSCSVSSVWWCDSVIATSPNSRVRCSCVLPARYVFFPGTLSNNPPKKHETEKNGITWGTPGCGLGPAAGWAPGAAIGHPPRRSHRPTAARSHELFQ